MKTLVKGSTYYMVLPTNRGNRIVKIEKNEGDLHVTHTCMMRKAGQNNSCNCVHDAVYKWIEVTGDRYEDILLHHDQVTLDPLAKMIR